MAYKVAIIGAGVSGALTARALSKYDMSIALIEKANDVAMGSTKANSAIVHAGFDAKPGTLKAKLNVIGCAEMADTCKTLHVPYKNIGSYVVAYSDKDMDHIKELYERGIKNGVPDMRIVGQEELLADEPNLNPESKGALLAKTAGIVCPYELCIAATECAVSNGVELIRNAGVQGIEDKDGMFVLHTAAGDIEAEYVINAAGIYADEIARMIGDDCMNIRARGGSYFLLDRSKGDTVKHVIFQCPTEKGKGSLVSPTVDNNLLIGPTSEFTDDKDDTGTVMAELIDVNVNTARIAPGVSSRDAITSFAGLRAHDESDDFVIGVSKANSRFINVGGIESPGLSASPAIAEYVEEIFLGAVDKKPEVLADYNPGRPAPVRFRHMTDEQRAELIAKNPAYGRIICRCETVTEGEIIDAIRAPGGARDVDGVKRRTRAGMGRCQGGFCGSKVVEILSRELNVPVNTITKFGAGSNILFDKTKEGSDNA